MKCQRKVMCQTEKEKIVWKQQLCTIVVVVVLFNLKHSYFSFFLKMRNSWDIRFIQLAFHVIQIRLVKSFIWNFLLHSFVFPMSCSYDCKCDTKQPHDHPLPERVSEIILFFCINYPFFHIEWFSNQWFKLSINYKNN